MFRLSFAERPGDLRRRANRLRDVARGVTDPVALREIERLIAELEERADKCEAQDAAPPQLIA